MTTTTTPRLTLADFLSVYAPDDLMEVRSLPPYGDVDGGRFYGTPVEIVAAADRIGRINLTRSVYYGVAPRSRPGGTREDVALCRCLFADFDAGTTTDTAWAIVADVGLPRPSRTVMSGGGCHLYWDLADPISPDDFESVQLRLIELVGSDPKPKDAPRVMRLPGTINCKPDRNGARCEVVEMTGERHDLEDIVMRLPEPQRETPPPSAERHNASADRGDAVRRAAAYVAAMPPAVAGERGHDRLMAATRQVYDGFDLDRAEAKKIIVNNFNTTCIPPWSDREIEHKLDEVEKVPGQRPRGWLLDADSRPRADATAEPLHPVPLPDDLPPVLPFDDAMLPASLRPWVSDIAERIQCPPDFPAVAAMVCLAAVVGRKVAIRPKRYDDWLVVPNLWGAVIGRPSIMKSPALAEPLKVLKRLEAEARERYEDERQAFDAGEMIRDAKRKLVGQEIKAAVKAGEDATAIAAAAVADVQAEPIRRRYLVNDSTVEKLGELLNENTNGLLASRDELIGLLKGLDKEGQECARAFYLEAWAGSDRFTYDRIGRGTIDIEACCVSVLGGIQPGPLGGYLADAIKGGKGDDGLMQRFQLAVWPDPSGTWRNVDRWPDSTAKDHAWQTYRRLDTMTPGDVGAVVQDEDDLPHLRYDDAAQERFDDWRYTLEHRLRSDLPPALEAALGKYRSLVPSLALLIQLADGPSAGTVQVDAIDKAIRWATYLESHANRTYAAATQPEVKAAKSIIGKIKGGDLIPPFTLRDIYNNGWSGLSDKAQAEAAIGMLLEYDWLSESEERTGGRSKKLYTPTAWNLQKGQKPLMQVLQATPGGGS